MRKDIFFMGIILTFIIACVVFIWWEKENQYEKGYTECKEIGGEYIVIDKKWSQTSKTNVNVYGCIMK